MFSIKWCLKKPLTGIISWKRRKKASFCAKVNLPSLVVPEVSKRLIKKFKVCQLKPQRLCLIKKASVAVSSTCFWLIIVKRGNLLIYLN